MAKMLPQIIGFSAVILFVLSYQCRSRRSIIACNAVSRTLYVLQYILLGAFEGAVLDILGLISCVLAQKIGNKASAKFRISVLAAVDIIIIAGGIAVYEDLFSILPIIGILLHTTAFWIKNERVMFAVSLLGSPFWMAYNLVKGAYGSAVGDMFTIVSVSAAMIKRK